MNDAVLERDGALSGDQRLESVLAQRRPILGRDQIEAVATQARGLAAHVVERQRRVGAEVGAPETLLDAAAPLDARLRSRLPALLTLRGQGREQGRRCRERPKDFSSFHEGGLYRPCRSCHCQARRPAVRSLRAAGPRARPETIRR